MSVQTSSYKSTSCSQCAHWKWGERYIIYASADDWNEFLLIDWNLCLKYANGRRRWMHLLWESRTNGEYFKMWKILKEFPDKFREYYGTCLLRNIIIDLEGTTHGLSVPRNFRNSWILSGQKKVSGRSFSRSSKGTIYVRNAFKA